MQRFRSFHSAWRTIQGIETVNMIRRGQIRQLAKDDTARQVALNSSLFSVTRAACLSRNNRVRRFRSRACNTSLRRQHDYLSGMDLIMRTRGFGRAGLLLALVVAPAFAEKPLADYSFVRGVCY